MGKDTKNIAMNILRQMYAITSLYYYSSETLKQQIVVFPNVYSPKFFLDSEIFARLISERANRKFVLEIGAGCGLVSLACAKNGGFVTATDISEEAVKNIQTNQTLTDIKLKYVCTGDLFRPLYKIDRRYDIIFFNHPWCDKSVDSIPEFACDLDYQVLQQFLKSAPHYLKRDGEILLGSSSLANNEKIISCAEACHYDIKILNVIETYMSECSEDNIRVLLYQLKK